MSVQDDGGPAFPRTEDAINYRNRDWNLDGMSLRDWFAGQALGAASAPADFHNDPKRCAEWYFGVADAMLKARQT